MNYYCKTVLLIDDNEIDNVLNERLIKANMFAKNVFICQTNKDALDFLMNEAIKNDSIPDIIFLDIRMPMGDGFDFLKAYQKLPIGTRNKTKIIMLTSSLEEEDINKALLNPLVNHILNKPLSFESLNELKRTL